MLFNVSLHTLNLKELEMECVSCNKLHRMPKTQKYHCICNLLMLSYCTIYKCCNFGWKFHC